MKGSTSSSTGKKDAAKKTQRKSPFHIRVCEDDGKTTRKNIGGDGAWVYAEQVVFCLLTHHQLSGSRPFTHFLKQQLVGSAIVLHPASQLSVQYLTQDVLLKVESVKCFGSDTQQQFCCIWQTGVSVEVQHEVSSQPRKHKVIFENIGGYQSELQRLSQHIDNLFCYHAGTSKIRPVKGVIISGPPGCGKSLIGKALKSRYEGKCVTVALEDIRSRVHGETEQNLRNCFSRAMSRAPSLVFLDDLDLLCSSREKGSQASVVTALLHLMDGLSAADSSGVMIVATATKCEVLDSALRRPGRLSEDVVLPLPDQTARADILDKLLAHVSHQLSEADMAVVVNRTHGFLGGDLRTLVVAARVEAEGTPLTLHHLQAALPAVTPSTLRDTSPSTRQERSEVVGYEGVVERLGELVHLTLTCRTVFEQCGLTPPARFLLFGPPGCGKSSIIRLVAQKFHLSVIAVKRSTVLGKYFGESEQNLAKIFKQASESSPCIIFFENFDGLAGGGRRREGGSMDAESRILNHLKVQLDGIVQHNTIFIMAETNRPDLLNKDVIRPGRFHEYIHVGLPVSGDRQLLLEKYLLPFVPMEEGEMEHLIEATDSFTVAEVLHLCEEVRLGWCGEEGGVAGDLIAECLAPLAPSVSHRMARMYTNFEQVYCTTSKT